MAKTHKPTKAEKREKLLLNIEDLLRQADEGADELISDLGEARDNMEEHFSETERFQRLSELVENLEYVQTGITDAIGSIENGIDFEWQNG